MRCNDAGLALIRRWEGKRNVAYWDVNGWACGYGCHRPDLKQGSMWSDAQCEAELIAHVEEIEKELDAIIVVTMPSNAWSALVSLAYNTGVGHLYNTTTIKLINAGDLTGAAARFPLWCLVDGMPNETLKQRRIAEMELFLTPDNGATS